MKSRRMKPRHVLTAAMLAFAAPVAAQQAPAPTTKATVTDADPALWVVKDADTTIYLFGTFHALKPNIGWFDDAVKTAFDKADTAVFEIDTSDKQAIMAALQPRMLSKQDEPFTDAMSEAEKARYVAAMTALGLPPTAFDAMKPWIAAINLTALSARQAGYDGADGAEATLIAAATKAGKTIATLETPDEQFGFFDSLSRDEQIAYLNETTEDMDDVGPMLDKMLKSWSAGDARRIGELMNEDLTDHQDLAELLLYSRNKRWAKKIKAMLDDPGTVFVAVGAGHLAGPKDVQADLKALGVTATRVDYD